MTSFKRWFGAGAIVLVALALVACPALVPDPVGKITPMTFTVGDGAQTVTDVDDLFTNTDDRSTFEAKSDKVGVATASISGTTLTVTPVAEGKATVTITATLSNGKTATTSFMVTVKAKPVDPTPPVDTHNDGPRMFRDLPDLNDLKVDVTPDPIDLSMHFKDDEGDEITYTAVSDDEGVVTVPRNVPGSMLRITVVSAPGTTTIHVTATDEHGLAVTESFDVTVINQAPMATDVNAQLSLSMVSPHNMSEVALARHFTDPEGDTLAYSVASVDPAEGVLTATVSGSALMLTADGAGEANVTIHATDNMSNGDVANEAAPKVFRVVVTAVPNMVPEVMTEIPDQPLTLVVMDMMESATTTLDLADYFEDPDGMPMPLRYSDDSDMTMIDGSMLTITADHSDSGTTTTITVTASDGADSIDDMFDVTVMAPPVPTLKKEIPNPTLNLGTDRTFTLGDHFDRATGYTAVPDDETVVTAAVSDDGTLTLTPVGVGSAEVDITPSNSGGNGTTESINVTVEGMAPAADKMFEAARVTVVADDGNGTGTDDADEEFSVAELEAVEAATERYMLLNYVTDPDGDDGMLTFSTSTSDNNVVAVYDTPTAAITGEITTDPDRVDVTDMEHLGNPTDAQLRQMSEDGADITIRGRSEGTATITVTATDADGLTSSWDFVVTVVSINRAPTINSNLTAFPGTDPAAEDYGHFVGLDNARRFKYEDIASGVTKTLKIDLATMFADLDRVIDAGRHTGDPWTFKAISTDEEVVTVELESTNNPEKHDEYNVIVTPVESGDAMIYFVVTDSFGESFGGETPATDDDDALITNTFFSVRVNHVPEAQGGQETDPLTLGAIKTYINRPVGEALPNLDLLDTGNTGAAAYFSDDDVGDTLACRFNMRGDPIFGHQAAPNENEPTRPTWVSGSERAVIDFPATVTRGTAYLDVWCWDQVGSPVADFEESPMATLMIQIRFDQSTQ